MAEGRRKSGGLSVRCTRAVAQRGAPLSRPARPLAGFGCRGFRLLPGPFRMELRDRERDLIATSDTMKRMIGTAEGRVAAYAFAIADPPRQH